MPLAWSLHRARRDQIAGEVRRELIAGKRRELIGGKRRDLIAAGRVGLGGGEAVLVGEHDQLGAVAGLQLGHRAAYLGLGGERAEDELTGDSGDGDGRGIRRVRALAGQRSAP